MDKGYQLALAKQKKNKYMNRDSTSLIKDRKETLLPS